MTIPLNPLPPPSFSSNTNATSPAPSSARIPTLLDPTGTVGLGHSQTPTTRRIAASATTATTWTSPPSLRGRLSVCVGTVFIAIINIHLVVPLGLFLLRLCHLDLSALAAADGIRSSNGLYIRVDSALAVIAVSASHIDVLGVVITA
ncbi:uncharacterized protein ANIA_10786 [Aspergillus nidulans FGSC A4]|uniref:Uncharacterized protein n=1 Tax=Emericella nidulans (strain FGSC A4 / ATCC 38163 / CBS 112.46 / NRRL 194 / M139) TaxID=227321 RepID=C8V205_EMENI|nr:hypothetical protein [Aspergillus nidulans FGSC A4]CBF69981.1 TPA: conserved hypothetical protein [Aspergillus nidulans FGSC A4]